MTYVLHYAPDNASLIVRMVLDHLDLPFKTSLVDRAARAQDSAQYRALNPIGLIPVLETPHGPMFETGAILLWIADTHAALAPQPTDPTRGEFLKWLFYLSNTVHPAERMLFYPDKYITPAASDTLQQGLRQHLLTCFAALNDAATHAPFDRLSVLHFYLAALLRWPALYPADTDRCWFDITRFPALHSLCQSIEALPCTARLQTAEGLGMTPFTAPQPPSPPEGTAT